MEMCERFLISPPVQSEHVDHVDIVRMKIETLPEQDLSGIEDAFRTAADQGRPHARFHLGVLYRRLQRPAEAQEMLRAAITENPVHPGAFYLLAESLWGASATGNPFQ